MEGLSPGSRVASDDRQPLLPLLLTLSVSAVLLLLAGGWKRVTLPRKCARHSCGHHSRTTDAQPGASVEDQMEEARGCHYYY